MDHEIIDNIIEKALLEGTDDAVKLKNKIWDNLETTTNLESRIYLNKRKPHKKWVRKTKNS